MVNLTQPAMLCFGKVPDDPVFRNHFLTVTAHLQAYKEVVPTLTVVATFFFLWTLLQNKCIWCVFVFVSLRHLPVKECLAFLVKHSTTSCSWWVLQYCSIHNGCLPSVYPRLSCWVVFDHTLLCQDWEQRQEEDNLLIERILLLVRNVLHVPADPNEEKVSTWKPLCMYVCLYLPHNSFYYCLCCCSCSW